MMDDRGDVPDEETPQGDLSWRQIDEIGNGDFPIERWR
jgi:hypothetical protein